MSETGNLLSSAPARGMRDMLPAEVAIRDWATGVIIRAYERFGFTRIDTPAMENIALLRRGEGGENLQLIFEVLKRGEKLERELSAGAVKRDELADLGLRFDLTVPLVRFYAHNQGSLPNPFKAIQIGNVWRAESPQAGRFRQFTQCDIDTIGVKSAAAEMELLQATAEALLNLSFKDFTIRINDRRVLSSLVESCGFASDRVAGVFITVDKLDKVGVPGVHNELTSKDHPGEAVSTLTKILERLQTVSQDKNAGFEPIKSVLPDSIPTEHFSAIGHIIAALKQQSEERYKVIFDPTLVRGMGYYTGPIFEFSAPGYSSSIAGGGRYDKMVGKFSGRDVPACGCSIGFERIMAILMEQGFTPPGRVHKTAVIFDQDRDNLESVIAAAGALRKKLDDHAASSNGTTRSTVVSSLPRKKEMRKQLDQLVAQGFDSYAVFREGQELEVKPLAST